LKKGSEIRSGSLKKGAKKVTRQEWSERRWSKRGAVRLVKAEKGRPCTK